MDTLNLTDAVEGDQQRTNKAMHPSAYSLRFGRKLPSLRLPEADELGCSPVMRNAAP